MQIVDVLWDRMRRIAGYDEVTDFEREALATFFAGPPRADSGACR